MPDGLVVSEALAHGSKLVFRLVAPAGFAPVARLVDAEELKSWSQAEAKTYLVELATTPASLGHIVPYRHDFRKAREPYKKGDLVILEGSKFGTQDVGTVRKVLTGEQGEKIAAAITTRIRGSDTGGLAKGMHRILWRCSNIERARRDGQASPLEMTVLSLLEARLPPGAKALGVGATLDGSYLRLFVEFGVCDASGGSVVRAARQKAAAAAAALGALLGCETEMFASRSPAGSVLAGGGEGTTSASFGAPGAPHSSSSNPADPAELAPTCREVKTEPFEQKLATTAPQDREAAEEEFVPSRHIKVSKVVKDKNTKKRLAKEKMKVTKPVKKATKKEVVSKNAKSAPNPESSISSESTSSNSSSVGSDIG